LQLALTMREVPHLRMATLECVKPDAPWVKCLICHASIKTCEAKTSRNIEGEMPNYTCPVHPEGVQISTGDWVCSMQCWDFATGPTLQATTAH